MGEYRAILLKLLVRLLIAGPCLLLSFYLLLNAGGDMFHGFAIGLFGMGAMLFAAIILAPPIARHIAQPLGNLYYSAQSFDRPQPMYGIPQTKRAKGLYEEAIKDYETIAESYPDLVKPWLEMIDIAVVNLKNADRANQFLERGLAALKGGKEKEQLTRMHTALLSKLPKPDSVPGGKPTIHFHGSHE